MKKIKVINDYNILITLNFNHLDGKVIKVLPKSFTFLNEEQLNYLTATSSVIRRGFLRIDGDVENLDEVKESINEDNLFDAERIESLLEMTIEGVTKEIQDVTNTIALRDLKQRAIETEKAKGFIKAIEERIAKLG